MSNSALIYPRTTTGPPVYCPRFGTLPGMTRIAYTVTATLPDPATADEYAAWLLGGHLGAVLAGGAEAATLVRLDPDPTPDSTREQGPQEVIQIEVRYLFPSRETFDRYLQVHAPALRADGLERFGPRRGIKFSRRTGTVVAALPGPI